MKYTAVFTLRFILLLSFLFPHFAAMADNHSKREFDVRPNAIDEFRSRQALQNKKKGTDSSSAEFEESDLGIQRPVDAKDTGFGYHLGFETKLYYSNNPASVKGGTFKTSAGVWENSLRNNFLLGAYDLGGASFSPLLSLNYTKFSHFGDDMFDTFDFDSMGLNFAGIFQFGKGWSLRPGLGYNMDLNPNDSLKKEYSQFSPALALGKSFEAGSVQSFLEWSVAYNFADSAYFVSTDDEMNRFETALMAGLNVPFGNFEFSPFLRFALVDYSKQNRSDFMTNLGLLLKYSLAEWANIKIFANISGRSSDLADDFSRIDSGISASLNAKF